MPERLSSESLAPRAQMGPAADAPVTGREYRHETATLCTTWATEGGGLTLTEALVSDVAGQLLPTTLLVRRLRPAGRPVGVKVGRGEGRERVENSGGARCINNKSTRA